MVRRKSDSGHSPQPRYCFPWLIAIRNRPRLRTSPWQVPNRIRSRCLAPRRRRPRRDDRSRARINSGISEGFMVGLLVAIEQVVNTSALCPGFGMAAPVCRPAPGLCVMRLGSEIEALIALPARGPPRRGRFALVTAATRRPGAGAADRNSYDRRSRRRNRQERRCPKLLRRRCPKHR